MKMMMSTSRTSIMGVMLISLFGPPPPPTDIPIRELLYNSLFLFRFRCGCGRIGRSRGLTLVLQLFGEKTQLVHAGSTKIVHHIYDLLVAGALVALYIHGLVQLV